MQEVSENIGAGEGNRTLVISLEGFCSTIELHPRRLQLRACNTQYNIRRGEKSTLLSSVRWEKDGA
jgi:hypothetical protein